MTADEKLAGIWAAALTPIDAEMRPDAPKAIAYYRDLLRSGCDGINTMGTTGEAMSFSAGQRLCFMEALASSGMPMDRFMVGTGATSLDDAALITRHAFDQGFAAALIMPPFFLRDASDDGILRFFDVLFTRATPPSKRVLLYNFPRMSGITFHPGLVDRLIAEFPGAIAGLKDSSNDSRLQAEILSRHRGLAVFPSSESDLLAAKAYGAAGCISGSICLWPQLARAVFTVGDASEAQSLSRRRALLVDVPLVAAVRYLTAKLCSDPTWEFPMPPLTTLSKEQKAAIGVLTDSIDRS